MNFLNPAVLFALGASALPLIIHFLSRRRAKDVPFPSIELLERLKTESIRRLRFKQLLLIAIRTLIVIMLVLAFARPAVNGLSGSGAASSAVIILDDSASMSSVHNGETLFELAKRNALEILATLNDRDNAAVILASSGETLAGSGMIVDISALEKRLAESECTLYANRAGDSIKRSLELLSESIAPNRELYYIGDGFGNALPDSVPESDAQIHAYAALVGPPESEGLSVDSFAVQNPILQVGKPVSVSVSGQTGSGGNDTTVEFYVDGERLGRKKLAVADGTFSGEFEFIPESPGLYSLLVQGNDHRYDAGESMRRVIAVPEMIRVLVIAETQRDSYFLSRALLVDDEVPPFNIKSVPPSQLNRNLISGADIIILSSVATLDKNLYNSIATAVIDAGTGLLVFPPERPENGLYHDAIFRDLAPVTVAQTSSQASSVPQVAIGSFDLSHPMLNGILLSDDFAKPRVFRSMVMTAQGQSEVIARFDDRSPAILLFESGKGRVILFSPGILAENGDFPLTGIFPPMLLRAVQYCAPSGLLTESLLTGESTSLSIAVDSMAETVSIRPEDGPARSFDYENIGGDMLISNPMTEKTGFYSVYADNTELARYSVDIPVSERGMNRSGTKMRIQAYKTMPFEILDTGNTIGDEILKKRIGSEIAWIFYLLTALLFVAEMIISRKA